MKRAKKPFYRRKRLLIPAGCALLAAVGWFGLPWMVTLPGSLMHAEAASPVLRDRHGEVLHRLTMDNFTRRIPVAREDIPEDLIRCTLAAEDKRFFSHGGIDLIATARAAKDWIANGEPVSGASTITQQLIKISRPSQPRTLRTKFGEWLAARQLEMRWSKEEILVAYLNRLDYGNLRIGSAEAARFYLQKPLEQLSLGECALLAGLPQAPSRLDPLGHPQRARARREVVLDRLVAAFPDQVRRVAAARSESLMLRPLSDEIRAPWLPQAMARDARTTLDASLQADVERMVTKTLKPLRSRNLQHMAVVVLHNPTREILAMVSSGDWNDPRGGKINGALTPRSPGSTLKPFTYLLAFENGRYPGSIVADIPTSFRTIEGLDAPQNFDRTYRGPVTIRRALANSLNVPAMRELNRLGGPQPLYHLLTSLGCDTLGDDPDSLGLGLTIGSAPVRLLDLTNAYATLAAGGRHRAVTLDPTADRAEPTRIFAQRSAYLVADILADNEARVSAFGPGNPLELPFTCAAKTGTSSDFRDNWCLGFTAEFTVGVWAGNFDNSPTDELTGADSAAPLFHRIMQRLHRDAKPTWVTRPDGLARLTIDPRSGRLAGPHVADSVTEWVPENAEPLVATAEDYDDSGRLILDELYAEWLASDHNRRRSEFAPEPRAPASSPLRVLAPQRGVTYQLDPELPNGGRLYLATNLPGLVRWQCDTLDLRPHDPEPIAILVPGHHTLRATDPRSGETTSIAIKVEPLGE